MNCETGEITNDPRRIKAWQDLGIPVLHLDAPDVANLPIRDVLNVDLDGESPHLLHLPPVAPALRESELLATLGAQIVDLKAEQAAAETRKREEFMRRVEANTR